MKALSLSLAVGIGLPLLALAIIFLIARAPDGYQGRLLVLVTETTSDTTAYGILAQAGLRPVRVIRELNGWVAEAEEPSGVAALKEQDAVRFIFRDIGLGTTLAGCLALATGPARPHSLQR